MTNIRCRLFAETGQTMTEYAFVLAFIFLVVLATIPLLGTSVLGFFNSLASAIGA